jgi:DUF971 family protein
MVRDEDVSEDIEPLSVQPVGNYAVQIVWDDGFNQVAPYELLLTLPRIGAEEAAARAEAAAQMAAAEAEAAGAVPPTAAQEILANAQPLKC